MLATFYEHPIHVLAFDGDYRIKVRLDGSERTSWLDVIYLDGFFEGHAGEIMDQARLLPQEDSPKVNHWEKWVKFTQRSSCFRVLAPKGRE